MQTKPVQLNQNRRRAAVAISVAMALILMACGSIGSVTSSISTAATAAAANGPASGTSAPGATPVTTALIPNTGIDCAATSRANQHFSQALAPLVNLTPETDYAGLTDPASPFYVDFAKLRADLSTLALLPDPTSAVELTFGKPSESVAYFQQLVDVAEADVKSLGKPFEDTSSTGQKVIGIETPWLKEMTAFSLALDKACKGFTLPTDAPASSQVTNQIGQTATLGDLQVTLDKVVTVPGQLGDLATAGNRFVFVSVTITNTGQVDLATTSVAQANFMDTAGTQYGLDFNAVMLSATHEINGQVAAGSTITGTKGYQVPVNAGDLVWIVEDNAGHRAVFAVPANSIIAEGTPVSASANADLETSVAATTAALIDMANSADATSAAMTANPGTPEPTDTPAP